MDYTMCLRSPTREKNEVVDIIGVEIMTYIGKSITRIDAIDKVQGKALYPGDITLPNQAYMKVLFANRNHARIRSIDTTEAETIDGVIAIFTAKDVPVNEYGLGVRDQPVLCGPGSSKPYADRVRFIGDQVAVVIAETEEIVFLITEFRLCLADQADRFPYFAWFEVTSAPLVTLVAPCRCAAMGTQSLDVTVREKSLALLAVTLLDDPGIDVTVLYKPPDDFLRACMVRGVICHSEMVELDHHTPESFGKMGMVAF